MSSLTSLVVCARIAVGYVTPGVGNGFELITAKDETLVVGILSWPASLDEQAPATFTRVFLTSH